MEIKLLADRMKWIRVENIEPYEYTYWIQGYPINHCMATLDNLTDIGVVATIRHMFESGYVLSMIQGAVLCFHKMGTEASNWLDFRCDKPEQYFGYYSEAIKVSAIKALTEESKRIITLN